MTTKRIAMQVSFALMVFCVTAVRLQAQFSLTVMGRVSEVSQGSIFLDKGSDDGISIGDQVSISNPDGLVINAVVRSVARRSSRCESATETRVHDSGILGKVALVIIDQETADAASGSLVDELAFAPDIHTDFDDATVPSHLYSLGGMIRIEVRVSASSVGSVYLDKGRAAGILPGDEVALYPADDGIVNATVQSVSKNSARCTILTGPRRTDVGTRGQVLSRPLPDAERAEPSGVSSGAPEHPPWTHESEDWAEGTPLLAPAYSRSLEERSPALHGRLFTNYFHTWNRSSSHNQYSLGRVGASMRMENPFRRGGGFRLDAEFNRRGVFLDDSPNDVDGPGRLDRLSYHWGGVEGRPLRLELGRFLSYEFPEFGVIDGTEVRYRAGVRHRFGASVGLLPEPFPNLSVSNDVHIGLFYRWVSDPDETFSSAIGYQKTWHKATPDRDLLVWSNDYVPNQFVSIHGAIWCDFYDSHDTLKSTDFEVTQMIFQPYFRLGQDRGIGGHVSYLRWPQLLRREFSPFVEQQIVADRVFRTGANFWRDIKKRIRISGRVGYWRDQDHVAGTNWETRVGYRDFLVKSSEFAIAVFYADGVSTSGPGARVSYSRSLPWCYASFSYDAASYRIGNEVSALGLGAATRRLMQQSAQANLDFSISSDKSVTVFSDYRFGHQQEALQAGLFIQKRL